MTSSIPSPFVVPRDDGSTPRFLNSVDRDLQQKYAYIASVLSRSKMTVQMLKNILKQLALASTGLKQILQDRLESFLTTASSPALFSSRVESLHALVKQEINGKGTSAQATALVSEMSGGSVGGMRSGAAFYTPPEPDNIVAKVKSMANSSDAVVPFAPPLLFGDSPFYRIKEAIKPGVILSRSTEQRGSRVEFSLPDYYLQQVTEESERKAKGEHVDPKYGVRLFGQMLSLEGGSRTASCEFPMALQLKVNDTTVEANTRGMKNKRGTTVPPDVTALLKPGARQRLDAWYSHTAESRFGIWAYVVESNSLDQVLDDIRSKKIQKAKALQILKSFGDDDIQSDTYPLKLRCPISYSRMEVPVRSVFCKHLQCFDGLSFLQMQHQAAQWRCPICDDPMSYVSLAADEFLTEILKHTSDRVDLVDLNPDGTYSIPKEESDIESSPEPEFMKKRKPEPVVIVSLDSSDDEEENVSSRPTPSTTTAPPPPPPTTTTAAALSNLNRSNSTSNLNNISNNSAHNLATNGALTNGHDVAPSSSGRPSLNGSSSSPVHASGNTSATSLPHSYSHASLADVHNSFAESRRSSMAPDSSAVPSPSSSSSPAFHPLPVPPVQSTGSVQNRVERSGSTHSNSSIPDPKRRRTSVEYDLPPWSGSLLSNAASYPDVITMVDDDSDDSTSPPRHLPTLPARVSSNLIGDLPSWESGIFSSKNNKKAVPSITTSSPSPDTSATSVSPSGTAPLNRSNAVIRRLPRLKQTVEVVDLTLSD